MTKSAIALTIKKAILAPIIALTLLLALFAPASAANSDLVSAISFSAVETVTFGVNLTGTIITAREINTVRVVGLMTDKTERHIDLSGAAYLYVYDATGNELIGDNDEFAIPKTTGVNERSSIYENLLIPAGYTINLKINRAGTMAPVRITVFLNETKVYEAELMPVDNGEIAPFVNEWSIMDDAKSSLTHGQYLDTTGNWAQEYIEKSVTEKGVNYGADEEAKLFSPSAPMTRAIFVESLAKMSGELIDAAIVYGPAPFDDVDIDSAGYKYIKWAHANGIIFGTSDTTFSPNETITRQDMATILNRFFVYKKITLPVILANPQKFTDEASVSNYALAHVLALQSAGIVGGYPDGSYGPKRPVSRAETAKVLWLLYDNGIIG